MGSFLREPGSLAFQVRKTWLGMRAALNTELKAYGLSTPQYATLMILSEEPGRSNSDLARAVSTTRQAANEMLANLERDGLIERRPHPADRRSHQLFLTDSGRRRLAEAKVAAARCEEEMEAGFTEQERKAVRKWLDGVAGACHELGSDQTRPR
jgi:DNA-binding MarR family transcriptional regulator